MIFMVLGAPGCGKGTQAKLLAQKYQLTHVSTGDLLRRECAAKTPLGLKIQDQIDQGHWAPTDLVQQVLLRELEKFPRGGFVLDGWPRYPEQKEILDAYLSRKGLRLDLVFYLELPPEEALQRILGRAREARQSGQDTRHDDNETVAQERLDLYFGHIESVLDYYRGRGVLRVIDDRPSVENVFAQIEGVADDYLKNR